MDMEKIIEVLLNEIYGLEEQVRYLKEDLDKVKTENVNLRDINRGLEKRIKELTDNERK